MRVSCVRCDDELRVVGAVCFSRDLNHVLRSNDVVSTFTNKHE